MIVLQANDITHEACLDECLRQSDYEKEKRAVEAFNAENKWRKRGIAVLPNRYGRLGKPANPSI